MSKDTEQFFIDAEAYLAQGRAALELKREEDLKALDALAAMLGIQAGRLERELHSSDPERFTAIVRELEAFARALEEQRSVVSEQLLGLVRFRQAGIAYLTAADSDKH